jgi:hypothetical protein
MANDVMFAGTSYKLRAGAPMPISSHGDFVLHTFRAEKLNTEVYIYTEHLPASDEFRGQGGDFISASYSRLSDLSGTVFQGKKNFSPEYIDEDDVYEGSASNDATEEFIECTSLNISYDVMGIATINYTIVRNAYGWPNPDLLNNLEFGGQTFTGWVTNLSVNRITDTDGWYECQVSLVTTTDGGLI